MGDNTHRPSRIRYKVYYWTAGTTIGNSCEKYRITRDAGITDLTFGYKDCSNVDQVVTITSGYRDFCAKIGTVVIFEGNYTLTDNGLCSSVNELPKGVVTANNQDGYENLQMSLALNNLNDVNAGGDSDYLSNGGGGGVVI